MFDMTLFQGWCPWCGTHMGGGGWFMMIFWLVVLVAILAVVWQVLQTGSSGGGAPGEDRAEHVLRERYARDEIDEEEYRRKLDELRR